MTKRIKVSLRTASLMCFGAMVDFEGVDIKKQLDNLVSRVFPTLLNV